RNRRRYGGYLVHLGVAVTLVGVAASSTFQHIRDVRLNPGQTARVARYDIRYVRPTSAVQPERVSLGAVLDIPKSGRHVVTIWPAGALALRRVRRPLPWRAPRPVPQS